MRKRETEGGRDTPVENKREGEVSSFRLDWLKEGQGGYLESLHLGQQPQLINKGLLEGEKRKGKKRSVEGMCLCFWNVTDKQREGGRLHLWVVKVDCGRKTHTK